MADQISVNADVTSDIDNAHTVEMLLSSLQASDADGAGAVLDEKVVMVTGSRRFAFRRLHSRADRVVAVSRAKEVTCHPSVSE